MKCSVCNSSKFCFFISTKEMMMDETKKMQFHFFKCEICESVFLESPVKKECLHKYYPNYYLPYRGEKAWGKYASFVKKSDDVLNYKRVQFVSKFLSSTCDYKNINILDLGCGKPDFLYSFKKKFDSYCTGIDFKESQWSNAKYNNLKLIETDWSQFNTLNRYDVITAWHYFEHDYNIIKTVDKCLKFLKPGGLLIIEVPMYQGLLARFQKEFWQGWHTPRHINLFSIKSWNFLFPIGSWNILKHTKYGTLDPFILWWLGRAEKYNIKWNVNFDKYFLTLAFLKGLTWPLFYLEKFIPFGIQTIVVQKNL